MLLVKWVTQQWHFVFNFRSMEANMGRHSSLVEGDKDDGTTQRYYCIGCEQG